MPCRARAPLLHPIGPQCYQQHGCASMTTVGMIVQADRSLLMRVGSISEFYRTNTDHTDAVVDCSGGRRRLVLHCAIPQCMADQSKHVHVGRTRTIRVMAIMVPATPLMKLASFAICITSTGNACACTEPRADRTLPLHITHALEWRQLVQCRECARQSHAAQWRYAVHSYFECCLPRKSVHLHAKL